MPAEAYDFAVNAGAVEVITVPARQHAGFYPYLGFSLVFPTRKMTLIPGLSVEAAPESGRWGFVWSLVADFAVHDRVGLDVDVVLIHDQPGADVGAAEFLLGAGVGFSVFWGKWTISPYVNVFRDLSVDGWALVPGLNFAATK
ncbi:MAG: hypothetical protein JWN44_5851 [Myxococcales bacterium]|nr:hypothetical protein [Myxococcales bacterium]